MPSWMLKAAVQSTLSHLPGSRSWNYLFQRYVTRSLELDKRQFESKLQYAKHHIGNYFRFQRQYHDRFNVLELGTGWYPVIPLACYLCGASKVWTIDKEPLLRRDNLRRTLLLFVDFVQQEDLSVILPWVQRDRLGAMVRASEYASTSDILTSLNLESLVLDARHTGLEHGSVDFLLSNSVLQEIPEQVLSDIFLEFRRLVSPVATMSHYVNMVEPYAIFDPVLTPYHFLQYPDSTWRWLNNSLHYHNRLRIPDYRRIHELAGFNILHEDNEHGSPNDLASVRLAKRFQQYTRDDLLVLRTWIVSALRN